MKRLLRLLCLLTFVGLFSTPAFAADEEALGQQVEQAGKYREALNHYVSALQKTDEGSDAGQRLREKIVKLSQKIQPSPAVPEEAERDMLRGEAAVEIAKDKSGFEKAAKEFQAALRIAPWLARGYFNLSVVLENVGDYAGAARNARLYLLAAPSAPDVDVVRKRIIKLEYKSEQTKAEELQKEDARRANQFLDIAGVWSKWKDGKWVETVELRIKEKTVEKKRIKHPFIPPDANWGWMAKDFSFDGKSFTYTALPLMIKNWKMTVMNRDFMVEEYISEGGERLMGGGLADTQEYRIEWKREH